MRIFLGLILMLLFACNPEPVESEVESRPVREDHTRYSDSKDAYLNFNSSSAINKIADIENEYFSQREDGVSKYYGTVWRQSAEGITLSSGISQYEDYLAEIGHDSIKPDSLHCTLYAYEGLKAGLTKEQLAKLEKEHRKIWKTREIAGWSIGFLLVKHFDWKAYLIIDPDSNEYDHCLKSFKKDQTYPVWRQPNIPLEQVFITGKDDSLVTDLLSQYEFGWGFSEQGIHTWITRYDELKECNWSGAPSTKYQVSKYENPLFLATDFVDYRDYGSHVILLPRRIVDSRLK